ncbi:hypothetical protein IscW_ISCW003603 [Ixodes scapularis]|uniref:Uncharacterized protein n=1 Tax=Ixodes scapularis TaxID=6945 RepID=B7PJZ6_IXOSC|nr:hypothetical protein IscW_ISCW003603 [Ixodes scapularis]|eukprot:XP_002408926.1 hypothetical protein IscW_ISCW003603 [Ixodes scapularis]
MGRRRGFARPAIGFWVAGHRQQCTQSARRVTLLVGVAFRRRRTWQKFLECLFFGESGSAI